MTSRFERITLFLFLFAIGMSLVTVGLAEEKIQIFDKEKKIVLTGEISKALGTYDEHLKGAVEYLVCSRSGKEYESIVVVDSSAKEIYEALLKLGVKRGTPPSYNEELGEETGPEGTGFLMYVEWEADGKTKRVRAEDLLYNVRTKKAMKHVAWTFSGSRMVYDLDSEDEDAQIPQAFMSNDLVALNYLDASALFQNPLPEAAAENTYKKNEKTLPPLGTAVKLIIEENRDVQLYILISGKVQGVGFRAFTQRTATELGVRGYAKNLPNGKVEVVAEGDKGTLDGLLKALYRGPSAAKVSDVKIEERPFSGTYKAFEIKY
jgi:acylphosphatase